MNFLRQFFESSSFSPHRYCLLGQPAVLWSTVISDAIIGLSYYSIPLALAWFVTRRKIDFGWIFWMFALFILACGTTHFLDIWTMWRADYGVLALVKVVTAAVSILTASILWPLVPRLLNLPTPGELQGVNAQLSRQVEEREHMMVVLAASEARFRDLYNLTPAPLASADANGVLIDVNEYWLQLMGYAREELIGKRAFDFVTPESARRMEEEIWPTLRTEGKVRDIELQYVRKSGAVLDVLMSSRVEHDDQGRLSRTYTVLVDVTARKQAEEALRHEIEERQRMKEMLHRSQKMEAVGQLTGGIAHDFNNLLTAINGNLDLLAVKTRGNDQVSRLIDSAERAIQRGASLTKQLLSFSRRQVLRPETFIVKSRFEAMATLLKGSLRSDIDLETKFESGLWPISVDPGEFDLAVINVCVNARDAMPKGGRLEVSAENVTLAPDENEERVGGDFVRLSIRDSGNGIPASVLPRVFEPFFTTKEVGKGTGLGLSQVYGFARQSGGIATIESEPGEGTTVSLFLPRSIAEPSVSIAHTRADPVRLTGNVLLVDDDDDVAVAAEGLIEDIGFTVRRARHPAEALEMLGPDGGRFDLVFSDIVMPGPMDGIAFAREVQVRFPLLPIVLTTGHSQAAAAAGPEFFILPKPYSRDQLLAVFASCR